MDIKIEKFSFHLLFILILGTLGGCTMDQKNTEQPIVEKANETTIKYFKEKENLDVVITGYEFAPSDFQTVFIKGHVKDDKTQAFTLHVEYGDSDYRVTSRTYSESLE
ncbi:hypothetical protein P4U05_16615 [Bacillus paranthracis]|uniref:DUF1433 domain-containing protein n=1 Tax=Bacillus paranthracis TaxID=2026186 RepID=A0AAJ1KBY6_9BACI|nr:MULTISPECIES: hypothetical protein [Bacillus]ADY20427.1 hypothetical protein YBT020_05905 [Bacillus thuringiensis serovar finitimus YBT-020]MRC72905.1 hypothetical protein [Bacillus thuringiensis]OTX71363.1 hypothetical protein BK722_13215 [Bacillus thuringiensis serovar finitimus]PDY87003.1 hypothetical protein CON09_24695 [Bacillus anthracis]MCR6799304.1 hypothetical protein [Bacillus paranthracis]